MKKFAWRICVAAGLALLALAAVGHGSANATGGLDYWKGTQARQDTVTRFFYDQSPQTIPPTYDPVAEAERYLRATQKPLPPTNPTARSLWHQIRTITVKSALSSRLGGLGTITLAAGSFEMGLKIGGVLNGKFLKVGIPAAGTSPGGCGSRTGSQLVYKPANTDIYFGALTAEDGWLWDFYFSGGACGSGYTTRWFGSQCTFSFPAAPSPYQTRSSSSSTATCFRYPNYLPVNPVSYGFVPENGTAEALEPRGPIEDQNGQPSTRTLPGPPAPNRPDVEQSVEDQLGQPDNDLLRDWLNYHLGAPGATDPFGLGPQNSLVEFPNWYTIFVDHGHEFAGIGDAEDFRRAATDVVERGDAFDPRVPKCQSPDGSTTYYWDAARSAIVVVRDGKIITFFKPESGKTYYDSQCA